MNTVLTSKRLLDPLVITWLLATLLIGLFSAATGTSPAFLILQVGIFLAALAAWKVLNPVSPLIAMVVLMTLAKNFLVSQPLKILFWQPADTNLMEPTMTAAAILTAACGAIAAGIVWRIFIRPLGIRGLLEPSLSRVNLRLASAILVWIGLAARTLWCVFHVPYAVAAYASLLVFFGVIIRIGIVRREFPDRVLDRFSIFALAAFCGLGLAQGSRTDILLAVFGFLPPIYLGLRRWPNRALILGGLAAMVPFVTIISPVIDYSRRLGAGTYNHADFSLIGSEFLKTMGGLVTDPEGTLDNVYAVDTTMEQSDVAHRRIYFGEPKGLLDRFTPAPVDNLVAVGVYQNLPVDYVTRSIMGLVPTFGAGRDNTVGQIELESAVSRIDAERASSGTQVGFANFGLTGVFFFMGGLTCVFVGYLISIMALFAISGWLFGSSNTLLTLAWFPIWMMLFADGNLSDTLTAAVHITTVIAGTVIAVFWTLQLYGQSRAGAVGYGSAV